jgi:hypothetical protein
MGEQAQDGGWRLIPPGDYPLTPTGAVLLAETQQKLTSAIAERDAWYETAAQHYCNETYYRDLLTRIGEIIGGAGYICDDGSLSDSVLRAKLPQIVADMVSRANDAAGSRAQLVDATDPAAVLNAWKPIVIEDSTDPGPALVAETVQRMAADTRECTCHPSEALNPCPRQYAYTECLASLAREAVVSGQCWGSIYADRGPAPSYASNCAAITATPGPDPETPRSKAAESAADLSGGKSNTGHPAGGRAIPLRALRGGDGIYRGD